MADHNPHRRALPTDRALNVVGDKWTLLILAEVHDGPQRFTELQRILNGISTEVIRSRLNRLVDEGLLERTRYKQVPPIVEYRLTDLGRYVLPVIAALADFGEHLPAQRYEEPLEGDTEGADRRLAQLRANVRTRDRP